MSEIASIRVVENEDMHPGQMVAMQADRIVWIGPIGDPDIVNIAFDTIIISPAAAARLHETQR